MAPPGSSPLASNRLEVTAAPTRTVLWLEDSPKDRRLIAEALRSLRGAPTVEFADDGQAFLDRLAESKPALAVLDLRMPGLDGMDILEHMHGHPIVARLPIVVFSGGDVTDRVAGHHYNVRACVRKPDDFDGFLRAVAEVVAHAEPAAGKA